VIAVAPYDPILNLKRIVIAAAPPPAGQPVSNRKPDAAEDGQSGRDSQKHQPDEEAHGQDSQAQQHQPEPGQRAFGNAIH